MKNHGEATIYDGHIDGGAFVVSAASNAAESADDINYTDGGFGPDDSITREQIALFIYRCENMPEVQNSVGFADKENISSYALQAVSWVTGKENNIMDPQGLATRAEVARWFMSEGGIK